jgi:hypothetical protein
LLAIKRKSLRETVKALFANIISTQTVPSNTFRSNRPFANMVRTCLRLASAPHADAAVHLINELGRRRRILRTGAGITSAAKLPVLHKAQLAPIWRSGKPLVAIGVQSELDKAAAAILAALAEMHGIHTRVEHAAALGANLEKLDLSSAVLICLCCMDMKSPIRIHDAARRLKSHAPPNAALLLGVLSENDGALRGLKDTVNADYVARSFRQALAIVLKLATEQRDGEDRG